jgi:hypothetical protein
MDAADRDVEPPRAVHPAARKRLGMVALLYAYRAIAALLIATPAALLAGSIVSGYPRGDAELFDPGGVMLVEAVRLARRSLIPLVLQGGLGAVVAALGGLLPFAALVVALGHEGKLSARFLTARAVAPVGPLVLLWGSALLAQVVVVGLVVMVGEKLLEQAGLDLFREDLARLGVFGVGLLAALAIGVLHDLARVIAVLEGRGFYVSAERALGVMERAYARVLWAYAWRGALAVAALSVAGWIAHRLGLSSSRSFGLVAVASQVSVLFAVFLRASWLAAAIRIMASVVVPAERSLAEELDDLAARAVAVAAEASDPLPEPPPEPQQQSVGESSSDLRNDEPGSKPAG